MKERPIIFSAPMVRAILDGRKTQTRRVVRPQPGGRLFRGMDSRWYRSALADERNPIRCPYGVPGNRLWVRETWQAFFADEVPADRPRGPRHTMGIPAQPERESFVFYRADGDLSHPEDGSEAIWLSPLHMPRWASRITLEIVSVRVERVQEISKEDARAEGVRVWEEWQSRDLPAVLNMHDPRDAYAQLWDSINAKRAPWSTNPWVWVIEFRRAGE